MSGAVARSCAPSSLIMLLIGICLIFFIAPGFNALVVSLSIESPIQFAEDGGIVHTPSMNLKNAPLLALIGTILATALLAWDLIFNILNVLRGLVPAVMLFSSLIYAFAALSVAVFFFVFHRLQS